MKAEVSDCIEMSVFSFKVNVVLVYRFLQQGRYEIHGSTYGTELLCWQNCALWFICKF